MSANINRRTFLKLGGASAAAAAVLTGCGPAARYVTRKPYYEMPEFGKVGVSTYYATTCLECPAGCGLVMRTMEGRALKAEGNPNHPVNAGKICSRGLTIVQGLYNPDRIQNPIRREQRGGEGTVMEWEEAFDVVRDALQTGSGAAFLLGAGSDHLYELVAELGPAIGAQGPTRYSAASMFDGRVSLMIAMMELYGEPFLPHFDIGASDVVFSFGADFMSGWLSPVSYARAYGRFRRGDVTRKRGTLISFEPRMSTASGAADQWIPVAPGSEGLVARAIAFLAGMDDSIGAAAVDEAVAASGVSSEKLSELAKLWAEASTPVAVVGSSPLMHSNGVAIAKAVMQLNANRVNTPGGMYLTNAQPQVSNAQGIQDLINRMNSGQVQALFIHGSNPLFDLPPALGFEAALANVPTVISFSSFPDETALQSDYVFPDHTPLESFGYVRNLPGTTQTVISAVQPVVAPFYNTRATADVLLEGARRAGIALGYSDEVAFIQARLGELVQEGGNIQNADPNAFWNSFLQAGGWWAETTAEANGATAAEGDTGAAAGVAGGEAPSPAVQPQGEDSFHLVTYTTHLGDGTGANRPWLQETPDSMTTVTWNSWVEINPETAKRLGIHHDDLVRVRSAVGEIEAAAYVYPAIRPDTIAIPFGQGHTALGRYAEGRGVNPMRLMEVVINEAGELALGDTLVTIEKTGRRRPLARMESIEGVYGHE